MRQCSVDQAAKLSFKPEEGMKVFIRGDVNVYEASGAYQLVCTNDGARWNWWIICCI